MWNTSGSYVHRFSIGVLLVSLLSAALLSIGGRLLIVNIEYYKTDIEEELARYGITGVSLDSIKGGWQGIHPVLKIKGAALSVPGRSQALYINELELSVKLIPSLISGDLQLKTFHTTVEKLILVSDQQGQWRLNNIELSPASSNRQGRLDIYAFFERLPDMVTVDIRLLQIRDERNKIDYLIQKGRLISHRENQQLALSLTADLPHTLGRQFQMMMTGNARQQKLYIEAGQLNLVNLIKLAGYQTSTLSQANLSIKSWVQLENYQASQIVNDAVFTQVLLNESEGEKYLPAIAGKISQKIQREDDRWRFDTYLTELQRGQQQLSGFNTQLYLDPKESPWLWVDRIDVAESLPFIKTFIQSNETISYLEGLNPSTEIYDLVIEWNKDDPVQSLAGFNFVNLKNDAFKSLPAVQGLSGKVVYARNNADLMLESSELMTNFSTLFRDPFRFSEFNAHVNLSRQDNQVILQADSFDIINSDIQLQGRAWLEASGSNKPYLSLRSNYQKGRVASTSKYLPVSIMQDNTVAWLDRAIKDGAIPRGDILFHGRLERISQLHNDSSGEFHALFEVENPQVEFLEQWPEASQGKGVASFHNTSMDLSFSDVRFASSKINQVDLSIPNFMRSELFITAKTVTRADNLIDSLSAMPILDMFDDIKQKSKRVEGEVRGVASLRIPLSKKIKSKETLTVDAELRDVGVSIPEWMVDFHRTNGNLRVNNNLVTAESLKTLYMGRKAELSVKSDNAAQSTRLTLSGNLNSQNLASLLPDYLQKPINGNSDWNLQVDIFNKSAKAHPLLKVQATSDLIRTQFDFPRPFKIDNAQEIAFQFSGNLYSNERFSFTSDWNDLIKAKGELNFQDNADVKLPSLSLVFGRESKSMEGKGIHLGGYVEQVNTNNWNRFIDTYFGDEEFKTGSILEQVKTVDLTLKQFTLGAQQLSDAKLKLDNKGNLLAGRIDSSHAKGSLSIPFQDKPDSPLQAKLDYFQVSKSRLKNKYNPDISDMPNLDITSKVVNLQGMVFNDFILKTRNTQNDFIIDQLDFRRDEVKLNSSGHWQYNVDTQDHVSVFNIALKGKDFGQTVSNLGLGDSLRKGEIDFNGQIGWSGTLYDVNWPTLIGEVKLNLKNGYLVNVDPGAGRFVGLLSYNALLKRLTLDFGDVLLEGMQFKKIQGNFTIQGETMTTQNARLDGPSAEVKLKGSSNLRSKTYDQTMIIIPKVGESLPVLGGLAAGASVGWGLLLLQKIFEKPIDKSVEIEYKLTGSWEEPELTLVSKPQPEPEPESDDIFRD